MSPLWLESTQILPKLNAAVFPTGRQLYDAPGCPAVTGGPSGEPTLPDADTVDEKPTHIVPVLSESAVIVQPTAFVGGEVDSNRTGTPEVTTVVTP